jgi:hypothetical protein
MPIACSLLVYLCFSCIRLRCNYIYAMWKPYVSRKSTLLVFAILPSQTSYAYSYTCYLLNTYYQGTDFDDLKIFKKITYKMTEEIQKNDLKEKEKEHFAYIL